MAHMYSGEFLGLAEDRTKSMYHLQQSAIGGLPNARHNLGVDKVDSGMDRAVKHWMVSAGRGFKYSLEKIRDGFMDGFVTKTEYDPWMR